MGKLQGLPALRGHAISLKIVDFNFTPKID